MASANKSLLQICNGAAADARLKPLNSIIGNIDTDAQLLRELATRAVEDLVFRNNGHWVALVSEHDFQTNVVRTTGNLVNGSPVITNIPDTSMLAPGIFETYGGFFPRTARIQEILEPGVVVMNYNASASGHNLDLTFSQAGYPLPDDFESFVDSTMWDRSRFWAMRGPLTPQQWQMYKSSVIGQATLQRRWRIMQAGNESYFFLDPTPGDVAQLVFEYNSNAPILSAMGESQVDWLADTDHCKLDGRVIELGVKYRLLDRLGQDFSTAFDEYERRADYYMAVDGGMGILDVAPVQWPALIGPWNPLGTGFGPPDGGSSGGGTGPTPAPPVPGNLDILVRLWMDACESQPTEAEIVALNTFVLTLRSTGLINKLTLIGIMSAPDPGAAVINLLAAHNPGYTQVNAPTFTPDVGFTMDGSSHLQHPDMYYPYIGESDATVLVYAKGPNETGQDLGAYLGTQTQVGVNPDGTLQVYPNSNTPVTTSLALPALYGFSRSDTDLFLVKNGVTVSATAALDGIGYDAMTVGRYSTRTYMMVLLGHYLTPTEHATLYTAAVTYLHTLGAV